MALKTLCGDVFKGVLVNERFPTLHLLLHIIILFGRSVSPLLLLRYYRR